MDYANKHRKETVKIKGQKWRECKSKKSSIPQYPFKCLADSQIYTQYTHSHTDAFSQDRHSYQVLVWGEPQKMVGTGIRHCRK